MFGRGHKRVIMSNGNCEFAPKMLDGSAKDSLYVFLCVGTDCIGP